MIVELIGVVNESLTEKPKLIGPSAGGAIVGTVGIQGICHSRSNSQHQAQNCERSDAQFHWERPLPEPLWHCTPEKPHVNAISYAALSAHRSYASHRETKSATSEILA